MPVRRLLGLAGATALLCGSATIAAPDFAPSARQAYDGFVGINPPRADVPIGALWIDGYGPTGAGAGADNLETVRSLSAITVDKNLQLAVSLGVLNLFGIDPRARDHYTARFADLSIVRVKDLARLSGPKGEPRIVEAIKAASVTVSSDRELGLNGQTIGGFSQASGSGTSGRTSSYAMEARDMVIAIRVATPEIVKGKERDLRVLDGTSARLDDFLLLPSRDHCGSSASPCLPRVGIAKINTQTVAAVEGVALDRNREARLALPVPISDGQEGLFDSLVVRWIPSCAAESVDPCRKAASLRVRYEGTRLKDAARVAARNW